ncbi:hypothetical protein K2173_013908 [Erythroxylum novogranatense]|uniref:Uncharacterized protein n=1 Tax=Erythroxylum novogranatense TaxID=1862640 RepID=A0AAV8SD56_9ROSI|nr:hypothetical protein K2173_013908 [Erythroxylum novogranatense]
MKDWSTFKIMMELDPLESIIQPVKRARTQSGLAGYGGGEMGNKITDPRYKYLHFSFTKHDAGSPNRPLEEIGRRHLPPHPVRVNPYPNRMFEGRQPQQRDSPYPFKRLTVEEIQRMKEQGFCYRCDAKYGPRHRCGEKQFHILLKDEEQLDDLQKEEAKLVNQVLILKPACEGDGSDILEVLEPSASSGPQTFKVKGKIAGKEFFPP